MENPETWASSLPGNHFIVSMIDRKAMKNSEKLCDACSMKSVSQKAMSWCTICEKAYCTTCEANHKTFKVSRNHKIVPIKDMNEDMSILNICAFVACDEHPDKTIEIYCMDHSQPCCTICATVHHRKCEQVITIDKAISGVKDSTKAKELTKKIKETSYKLEEIIQNRNQNTTNFKKEIDVVLVEITNMRKKLNENLDKLENKMREEVNSVRKDNVLRLSEESTELSALKNTVCFGRLHFNKQRSSLPGSKTINFHTGKFKVLFTVDIKDSFISWIFFNDDIIITDCDRKRVVFHDNTGKQTGVLSIPNEPNDVTKVNDQTVAVSSAWKILIINATPLKLVKTLDVNVSVCGLNFVNKST
ncbi:unnamed protein product [Mytilus coruscus]|uniref:B box-type domain-containing protein n=1 Tax=Mytilus coruscus TaxID=42192 RepID=A0A6J8C3I3_MYTCO|nr:unnamed protein product [Mytilus coruscus]